MSSQPTIALDIKIASYRNKGTGRYVINLIRHLFSRDKHKYVTISGPRTDWDDLPSHNFKDIPGLHQKIQSTLLRSFFLVPPSLALNNIQLIHTFDSNTIIKPYFCKYKRVATLHDVIVYCHPEFFTRKHRFIVQNLIAYTVKKADHIICSSISTKNDLLSFFPKVKEEKISVIHLAADENFFPAQKDSVINFLSMRKLPQKYLLCVGTLEPRKNFGRILESFKNLRKKSCYQELNLLIVGGKGWLESGVNESKEELKKKGIYLLGFIPEEELPLLYSGAIALVYPSLYEGFGLPATEAMACGTPVILSNNSSLPEIAGEGALLVDPLSVNEISAAMKKIYDNKTFHKNLSTNAIKQSKNFSWEKTAEKVEKVYTKVLDY